MHVHLKYRWGRLKQLFFKQPVSYKPFELLLTGLVGEGIHLE